MQKRKAKENKKKKQKMKTKVTRQPAARSYQAARGNRNTRRIIKNRELVRDVSSTVNFATVSYRENPGFSHWIWASQQAKGYERYRVKKLAYEIVPLYGNTDAKGKFFLAFDLDPNDGNPPSGDSGMRDLVASEFVIDTPSWKAARLSLPASKLMSGIQTKTVRDGPVHGSLREYDMGSVIVGTVGFDNDGTVVGQLYVDYEIELLSPQVNVRVAAPRNTTTWRATENLDLADNTWTNVVWGANPTITGQLNIALNDAKDTFTVKPGTYFITVGVRTYTGADIISFGQINDWKSQIVINDVGVHWGIGFWKETTTVGGNYQTADDFRLRAGYYHSTEEFTVQYRLHSNLADPIPSQNVYQGYITFHLVC